MLALSEELISLADGGKYHIYAMYHVTYIIYHIYYIIFTVPFDFICTTRCFAWNHALDAENIAAVYRGTVRAQNNGSLEYSSMSAAAQNSLVLTCPCVCLLLEI